MNAICNQFEADPLIEQRRGQQPRLSMMNRRHRVKCMGYLMNIQAVDHFAHFIIGSSRMTNGQTDSLFSGPFNQRL